jgi:hypothetical protein
VEVVELVLTKYIFELDGVVGKEAPVTTIPSISFQIIALPVFIRS